MGREPGGAAVLGADLVESRGGERDRYASLLLGGPSTPLGTPLGRVSQERLTAQVACPYEAVHTLCFCSLRVRAARRPAIPAASPAPKPGWGTCWAAALSATSVTRIAGKQSVHV